MKKIFTTLAALTVLMTLTTSCNKKLKEDMDDLEKSLNEQKSKGDNLQNQVNTLNGILVRTPIKVKFSTKDYDNEDVVIEGSYSMVGNSDYNTSVVMDNEDGTYIIYVSRRGDISGDYFTEIAFQYNPTTKVTTDIYVMARGATPKYGIFSGRFSGTSNIVHTMTVNSFDYTAGTISFNYSGTTATAYTYNLFYDKSMSLSLEYSGSLVKSSNLGI